MHTHTLPNIPVPPDYKEKWKKIIIQNHLSNIKTLFNLWFILRNENRQAFE